MEWSPWKVICTFLVSAASVAICYIIGDMIRVWLAMYDRMVTYA